MVDYSFSQLISQPIELRNKTSSRASYFSQSEKIQLYDYDAFLNNKNEKCKSQSAGATIQPGNVSKIIQWLFWRKSEERSATEANPAIRSLMKVNNFFTLCFKSCFFVTL